MDKRKMGIVGGAAAGLFLLGLLVGYASFSSKGKVSDLTQQLEAEKTAHAADIVKAKAGSEQALKDKTAECEKLQADLAAQQKDSAAKQAELKQRTEKAEFEAKDIKGRFDKETERLNKELTDLKKGAVSGPDVPKLVEGLVKAWPAWVSLAMVSNMLADEVMASRYRAPDKKTIEDDVAEILKASKVYEDASAAVYQHVQSRRNELRDAGFDCAALEKTFSAETRKLAANIVSQVQSFNDGVAMEVVEVDSTKGFADTRVQVSKGDLIFLAPEDPKHASWQMSQEWGERGPEGWDNVPGHLKVTQDLRGGAAIMKIGVSEAYLPGYGQMPVVTPEEGRIRVGINDKKLDDNTGAIKFVVVKVSSSALAKFGEFWKETRKILR
jgi:hypothetical protein